MKTLIVGYGNPDRQDDGLSLHLLIELARILGRTVDESPENCFYPVGDEPDLWFCLQLVPEMAQTISQYDRVCFLDAHTGFSDEIMATRLAPAFEHSVLTHHLSPATLLNICQTLSGSTPDALLISVKGYQFGFSRSLSQQAQDLLPQAVQRVVAWLRE